MTSVPTTHTDVDTLAVGTLIASPDDTISAVTVEVMETTPLQRACDLSLPLTYRLEVFHALSVEEQQDTLGKLLSTFAFTNTGHLGAYLRALCASNTLFSDMTRLDTLQQLCLAPKRTQDSICALAQMCAVRSEEIPVVVYADALFMLARCDPLLYSGYFTHNILEDTRIDDRTRYSALVKSKDCVSLSFFVEASLAFLQCSVNDSRFHIMACEALFAIEDVDLDVVVEAETFLCDIMNSITMDTNVRADAADVLVRYKSHYKEEADEVLVQLGTAHLGVLSHLYDNKQNVHCMERDMDQIMESLGADTTLVYEEACTRLYTHCKDPTSFDFAKFRILHAEGTSIGDYSLLDIFRRVYGFAERHEHRESIEQRLCEEFEEMAYTCVSGYAQRLLNALMGFVGMPMAIRWSAQIQANLIGRLNACIRESEHVDQVLSELTVENLNQRPAMLGVLRKHMSRIQSEMREEFEPYIGLDVFDFELRKAMLAFEGIDL